MEIDEDVNKEEFLEKVRKIAKENEMKYDDALSVYYDKYYELKSKNPKKFAGYWAVHALNYLRRMKNVQEKIYFGDYDDRMYFRIQSKLKEDFLRECNKYGINASEVLRDYVEKWVKGKVW